MKIREDFVSNSSSSSYIIDVGKKSHVEAAALVIESIGDGEDWLEGMFKDNVALTACNIYYKMDGVDYFWHNNVPAGISMSPKVVAAYFDETGEVRKDLDKKTVIKSLSWNTETGSENERIVYESRANGMMVTEKTVKFTKWLIDACKEVFQECVELEYDSGDAEVAKKNLDDIEKSLAAGNSVYIIRTCYSGDPDCGLYVADSRNDKDNGWIRLRKKCNYMNWMPT